MTSNKIHFLGGTAELQDGELIVKININEAQGLTNTRKSVAIASTKGPIFLGDGVSLNLLAYRPKTHFSDEELENLEPISNINWELVRR